MLIDLDDSVDSGIFSARSYLPLIQKDFVTRMHGLTVHGKKRLKFFKTQLENSADSYLRFRLALLHSVSYFFLIYQSPSLSLCTIFDAISSNIDKVISINLSAGVFDFGDSNVHHKDWLTYSGGTEISNDLTQMINGPIWIPDNNFNSPALLDARIFSTMTVPPLGISDHIFVWISIDFPSN